jgi:NADH-quinone oxidoreductase subunit J
MTFTDALFWIIAGVTGASAVMVVVTQNIVRAAVWLLFTLVGVTGVYFLLGADFVGATQLIVYVGGILVLVVFGVMLTAQGPFVSMRAGAGEWVIVTVVGLTFFGLLAATTALAAWRGTTPSDHLPESNPATSPSVVQLGATFLGITEATPKELPKRDRDTGDILLDPKTGLPQYEPVRLTGVPEVKTKDGHPVPPPDRQRVAYLLPFEIVSVHLTVVLIGAAYLARAKRRREVST